MIRVEMIFFAGLLVGVIVGVIGTRVLQRYLAWRDQRLAKVRVRDQLHEVETPELIDELSKRDDLGRPPKEGRER